MNLQLDSPKLDYAFWMNFEVHYEGELQVFQNIGQSRIFTVWLGP